MANIAAYLEKALLDWTLGGATPTRPTAASVAVGLSLGVPASTSGSEMVLGSGYSRQLCGSFGAAASPGGSATNTAAMTFGPFSSAYSITGIQIWDTSTATVNIGNMLFYGTLATARTVGVGDSLVIASGALTAAIA